MFTMMNEARLKVGLQGLGAPRALTRKQWPTRGSGFRAGCRLSSTLM